MVGQNLAGDAGVAGAMPGLAGTYAVLPGPVRPGTLRIGRVGELDLFSDCLVYA
jgi:hypothetical protein